MKTISVPITSEAMNRLNYDKCLIGDLIGLKLAGKEYSTIQNTGFFDEMNRDQGTLIDDFEDEIITDPNLID